MTNTDLQSSNIEEEKVDDRVTSVDLQHDQQNKLYRKPVDDKTNTDLQSSNIMTNSDLQFSAVKSNIILQDQLTQSTNNSEVTKSEK